MDLRQLRYFVEIVEQGSFTAAAASLNVAQPALSLHLKNMERHLGTPLLTRSRAGVTATEAGELLARRARMLLNEHSRLEDEVRHFKSDPSGSIRIGISGTISGIVGLPLVRLARQRYPGINLTIAEAMSGFLQEWLSDARIDIALLYNEKAQPGQVARTLLQEELAILSPVSMALDPVVSVQDLAGLPLILPSVNHGLRVQMDEVFRAHRLTPQVVQEIDSYTNIKALVMAGYGASVLPWQAISGAQDDPRFRKSRIAPPGLWRSVSLIMSTERPETRAQTAIAGILDQVFDDLLKTGAWIGARKPVGAT